MLCESVLSTTKQLGTGLKSEALASTALLYEAVNIDP